MESPRPRAITTTALPAERFAITISGERSGRVLRQMVVSEATAARICSVLDTGGDIVNAGAELIRAGQNLARILEPLAGPPRKLPPRGRR